MAHSNSYRIFAWVVIILLVVVVATLLANGTIPNKWREWRDHLQSANQKPSIALLPGTASPAPIQTASALPTATVPARTATPAPVPTVVPTYTPAPTANALPDTGPAALPLTLVVGGGILGLYLFGARQRLKKSASSIDIR